MYHKFKEIPKPEGNDFFNVTAGEIKAGDLWHVAGKWLTVPCGIVGLDVTDYQPIYRRNFRLQPVDYPKKCT